SVGPVQLPLRRRQPAVFTADLAGAARQARVATSAPLHLRLGKTRWLLRPRRIARLLELPSGGRTTLAVAGPAARQWLVALGRRVEKPARDATFAVDGTHVHVVPARPGVQLDATRTAQRLLRAA